MKISPVNMEARKNLDLRAGDTVRVYQKIEEKGKIRLQPFEGLVLARNHGTENGATFTVRRTSDGYGVEKIFPLYSPMIDRIEITKRSKTRRSKLYNIRRQALKQISKRMKMMFVDIKSNEEIVEEEPEVVEGEAQPETPTEETKAETTPEEEVKEEAPTEENKEEVQAEEPKKEDKAE
jgi:large subunit ribosomal protein L19